MQNNPQRIRFNRGSTSAPEADKEWFKKANKSGKWV
jgi:nitrate reductase beta subunit